MTTRLSFACRTGVALSCLTAAAHCAAAAQLDVLPADVPLAAPSPAACDAAPCAAASASLHPGLASGARNPQRTFPRWRGVAAAVSEQTLGALRGGFQTAGGLQLSFGIERMVYINGALTTSTRITVAGFGGLAGEVAPRLVRGGDSGLSLVRNGVGNTFVAGLLPPSTQATVIQNTLNDQHIQSLTFISAQANSLAVLRSWNLQMSIRDAVTGSLRR
jgi:hypothetical protein